MGKTGKTFAVARTRNGLCEAFQKLWMWRSGIECLSGNGTLLIKAIFNLSDRVVVEAMSENPYLQYFLGFKLFQTEPTFNASLMTHFRKRLSAKVINRFNEKIIELARKDSSTDDVPPPERRGKPDGKPNLKRN